MGVETEAATAPTKAARQTRTAHVAAAIFLMTAAFMLAKTGRDALYFTARGLYDLPRAYLGIATLALPLALIVLGLMKWLGPRRVRLVLPLAMALVLGIYARVAQPGGGPLMTFFFMLVPLVFGVVFSTAWLLGADLLDGVAHDGLARSYATIGAASIVGGLAGGVVAISLARRVDPHVLIALGAVALVLSVIVIAAAQRRYPPRRLAGAGSRVAPDAVSVRAVLGERYTLLLLLVAVAAALVGVLVEFQFYLSAGTAGLSARANANFFANAYLALNASAFVVQLWLLPALQRRIGVNGALLVLPAVLFGGGAALLANASMAMRAFLRVAEGGLKSSVHRTSWEQAYLPIARMNRPVAKLIVDGAAARLAEGGAALGLFVWLRRMEGEGLVGRDISWISWALIGSALVWIALTRLLSARIGSVTDAPGSELEFRPDIPLPDT